MSEATSGELASAGTNSGQLASAGTNSDVQLVILGAGRPGRGDSPTALVDIDARGRVMDWILDAFGPLAPKKVWFVGGYRAEDVIERYQQISPIFNHEWRTTGSLASLRLVPLAADTTTYVTYSDVVYRAPEVAALAAAPGPVAVAVDSRWRDRYDARSRQALDTAERVSVANGTILAIGNAVGTDAATGEFAGLLRISAAALTTMTDILHREPFAPTAGLPELIQAALLRGLDAHAVDWLGAWAELDARQDLARFVLGTKAESLARLQPMDHGGVIAPLVAFANSEWREARDGCVTRILEAFGDARVIVRSSARSEDGWNESAAGAYTSLLDVATSPDALAAAIDSVFASYGAANPDDQVLIQTMLRDVAMSGVAMTRTHATGAPYFVVNFDDSTARTDTVTGGADARTVVIHRPATTAATRVAAGVLAPVIETVRRIEGLVGHDSLDIEFAVTTDDRVHVLQVRPIAAVGASGVADDAAVAAALGRAREQVAALAARNPRLVGTRSRLSVMTDWNPAEIIGTKPKRLAASLYRLLITDEIWARQRAEFGYRDVRPCPLLIDVVGHPYVDVRASFSSFVPAAIPDGLAGRVVDSALSYLDAHPELHDKVEFAVMPTSMTATFSADADRLRAHGVSDSEIEELRRALADLTANAFARVPDDINTMHAADRRITAQLHSPTAPLEQVWSLLEIARDGATLSFAHLARGAFVATALLRSFVATNAVSAPRMDALLASIETVLGRMQDDAGRVRRAELAWNEFVDRYGHLRPGTYDITSACYRDDPEGYLRPIVSAADPPRADAFAWTGAERDAISRALAAAELPDDVDEFTRFAALAIAGREESKFVFTKALSGALEAIVAYGTQIGVDRDSLAFISIDDLRAVRDSGTDPRHFLTRRATEGRDAHALTRGVALPAQITGPNDIDAFEQEAAEPNFVTAQAVEAELLSTGVTPEHEVDGRIVIIPTADPGYDWLMARGLVGLITMYGGANSHMAVRAAERSLPAAIGVGEQRYAQLLGAAVLRLDCASRTITVVR